MSEQSRIRAIFSGNVQGVGFRATTQSLAQDFRVVGTVRNRSDGTVEVVAEGTESELDAFLKSVAEQLSHHVDAVETQRGEATGQFDRFRIAF